MTQGVPFYTTAPPAIEIASNMITASNRYGIGLLSTRAGNIHNNVVVDSGNPAWWTQCGIALVGLDIAGVNDYPENITIASNLVEARTVNTGCGILVNTSQGVTLQKNKGGPRAELW